MSPAELVLLEETEQIVGFALAVLVSWFSARRLAVVLGQCIPKQEQSTSTTIPSINP
jgi:hypothetical protein